MNEPDPPELIRFRYRPGRLFAELAHPGADGPGVFTAVIETAELEHGLDPVGEDYSGERVLVQVREAVPGAELELVHFSLIEWQQLVGAHRRWWIEFAETSADSSDADDQDDS